MSARNKARKSTGPRTSTSSSNTNTQGRRSANLNNSTINSSVRTRSSSSSDCDTPTQRLNTRVQSSQNNISSIPGPSGTSRLISSDSEAEHDDTTQTLPTGRRQFTRIQRAESSNDTTSDSDQANRHDKSINNGNGAKSRKLNNKSTAVGNKKKSNKAKKDDSTSEEEYEPPKKGASVNHSASFSKQNISSLVNRCVYYLIVADQKKYSIKKQDILKNVFCPQNRQLYAEVIKAAGEQLKKTYGMELLSHEQKKGEYLMINILNHDLQVQELAEYTGTPPEREKRGFLFYLLTVIFMNDKSISEVELGAALKILGIDINSKAPHPVFGDVKKYLTSELVKQMYLEYKCICKDPPHYEFSWGVRAHQEFDKKDLLEFACEIMIDTKPSDWILQYKDAIGSARQPEE